MSDLLESLLPEQSRKECAKHDQALNFGWHGMHRPFLVQVKDGSRVVLEFGAMGRDSMTVAAQHECLTEPGQYVFVSPVKQEPFPVLAAKQQLACVDLADVADQFRKQGVM